ELAAQRDRARACHAHHRLGVAHSAAGGQRTQGGPLGADALRVAPIDAGGDLGEKGAVGVEAVEVRRAAQAQALFDPAFEMAVRSLDAAVLMAAPAVIAARLHPVGGAQRVVARGDIGLGGGIEIFEGGREAIGAVLGGYPAQALEGLDQPLGQRCVALAAEHEADMAVAAVGQAKVIEAVIERLTADRDDDTLEHGEVREPAQAWAVDLRKHHLVLRPKARPPVLDPALEGAQELVWVLPRIPLLEPLEKGQCLQLRDNSELLGELVPDLGKGIRSRAPMPGPAGASAALALLDAPGGALGEAGLGGGGHLRLPKLSF